MRREQHLGSDDLLDLGGVAMVEQAVGGDVLVGGAEQAGVLQRATGAAHAGDRVDDDARRLDRTLAHEGRQGEARRRDVAARRGDQPGALELAAVQLGQPVDRLGEQLRLVVLEPVPAGVQAGVLQPVGGGEVDDAADPPDELRGERHRRLVGKPEEHEIELAGPIDVERLEHEVGVARRQARVERGSRGAGLAVAGGVPHVELGVLGAEAQELGSRVARGADDADCDHRRKIIHAHA